MIRAAAAIALAFLLGCDGDDAVSPQAPGHAVFYASAAASGQVQSLIHSCNLDNLEKKLLAEDAGGVWSIQSSDDGSFIAWSSTIVSSPIYPAASEPPLRWTTYLRVARPDGSHLRALDDQLVSLAEVRIGPDGKIVYMVKDARIRIADPASETLTDLTDASYYAFSPAFSPDGSAIVFASNKDHLEESPSETDIYRMKSDGTGKQRLTFTNSVTSNPQFSPDGQWISYIAKPTLFGQDTLVVMGADGGSHREVFRLNDAIIQSYSWSPDGEFIAVCTIPNQYDIHARGDIFRVQVSTGVVKNLTPEDDLDELAVWNRTGDGILFLSNRDDPGSGNFEVYVMNGDGQGAYRITTDVPSQTAITWR